MVTVVFVVLVVLVVVLVVLAEDADAEVVEADADDVDAEAEDVEVDAVDEVAEEALSLVAVAVVEADWADPEFDAPGFSTKNASAPAAMRTATAATIGTATEAVLRFGAGVKLLLLV